MTKECNLLAAVFPRMLFALRSFQLEHGFFSHQNPERANKYDKDYFVRILQHFVRLNKFIYNYENIFRVRPKSLPAAVETQALDKLQKSRHFLRKDTKKNDSGMDIRDDDTEKIDPYYSIKTEYTRPSEKPHNERLKEAQSISKLLYEKLDSILKSSGIDPKKKAEEG
jgi:hypothetical protein